MQNNKDKSNNKGLIKGDLFKRGRKKTTKNTNEREGSSSSSSSSNEMTFGRLETYVTGSDGRAHFMCLNGHILEKHMVRLYLSHYSKHHLRV